MTVLMRKLVIVASFSVLFLLAFATGGLAQTSALEGEVIGEDGQPVRGAVIMITRTDISGNYKTKSNKKGRFFHAGLPLGVYNVACEIDGKR